MPTISAKSELVTLINVFTVEASQQQRVAEMLTEATEKTMRQIPEFVSASIHKRFRQHS